MNVNEYNSDANDKIILTEEQLNAEKADFLARMSHELKTPMNAIIGMTYVAKSSGDMRKIKECLNRIDSASRHLLSMINDIFDFNSMQAGKFKICQSDFNLIGLLHEIHDVYSYTVSEKKQKLTIILNDDVPAWLCGDRLRISQVINNLLSNATKFTPERGEISLEITLNSINNGIADILFTVSDTGIGISEEDINNLFKPFVQANGTISRNFDGIGLGLSVSNELVNLMGGEISVNSTPGIGSTFSFTLPLSVIDGYDEKRDETFSPKKPVSVFASKYDFRDRTILAVDDMKTNLDSVEALLADTGVRLLLANDGQMAVDIFEKEQKNIDLILMDIQMPVLDGHSATKKIRSLPTEYAKTVCIVALSINSRREDVKASLDCGMNDHVCKPIDPDELLSKLQKFLDKNGDANMGLFSKKDDKKPDDSCSEFASFSPYIKVDEGLNRVRGNKALYAKMLGSFRGNTKIAEDIKKAAEQKDLESLKFHVHSMKGIAGNLSLSELSEKLSVLDNALKTGKYDEKYYNDAEAAFYNTSAKIDMLISVLK